VADTDNKQERDALQRLNGYVPIASLYAVVCGTLYLWGFWSTFEINILQYIGLVDLAKAAAFPLVSAVASVTVGSLIGQLTAGRILPHGGGEGTAVGTFLRRRTRVLLGIYVALMLSVLFVQTEGKWLVFGVMLSVIPSYVLANRGVLIDVIPDDGLRGTVVSTLCLLICAGFGFGRVRAADIVTGSEYFVVDQASIAHVAGVRGSLAGELKYLGHAGDYVFLLAPDSTIEILRADAVPVLVIRHTKPVKQQAG
jgi:hypothetical protein